MVRTSTGHASQQRASDLLAEAQSTDRETVIEIGRAAMASRNTPVDDYERSLRLMLGRGDWPSAGHHVIAIDCYTGERVVIDHESGIPIATACAASSSLPGVNGPVWIDDRYCMDGGIGTSSTHSDLLAGTERASAGTRTLLVAANPDPGIDFMDPARLAGAIEDGRARASSMIGDLGAVWH